MRARRQIKGSSAAGLVLPAHPAALGHTSQGGGNEALCPLLALGTGLAPSPFFPPFAPKKAPDPPSGEYLATATGACGWHPGPAQHRCQEARWTSNGQTKGFIPSTV